MEKLIFYVNFICSQIAVLIFEKYPNEILSRMLIEIDLSAVWAASHKSHEMTLLQGSNSYESSFNSTAQEDLPGLVLSFSNATTPGTARKSIKIIHSCEKRANVCTSALFTTIFVVDYSGGFCCSICSCTNSRCPNGNLSFCARIHI